MLKYILQLCLIFFGSISAPAQQDIFQRQKAVSDSLKKALENYKKADADRANALAKLIDVALFKKQKEAVMEYHDELLQLSKKLNLVRNVSYCYFWKGLYYKSSRNIPLALAYLDTSISIAEKHTDKDVTKQLAITLRSKAQIYREQEQHYTALQYLFDALPIIEKDPTYHTEDTYLDIADCYKKTGSYDKAIVYINKALQLEETGKIKHDNSTNTEIYGTAYEELTELYLKKNDPVTARQFAEKLRQNEPDLTRNDFSNSYYEHLGTIMLLENKIDSSNYFYLLGLKYSDPEDHSMITSKILNKLSKNYLAIGNVTLSKKYALQEWELAQESGNKELMIAALRNRASGFIKMGQAQKAAEDFNIAFALNDTLIADNDTRLSNNLAAIYETGNKEKEMAQLRVEKIKQLQEVRQKSTINKLLVASAAALILISFLGYQNFKQKQKLQQQKITELKKAAAEEKLKMNLLENEQLKNKLETEQVVNYFSNSLIDKNTVEGALWDVAKNLIGKLGFEDCMMYLWNDDKTKMIQKAGYGPKGSIEEINKNIFDAVPGQGIVGYVMETKQGLLIADTSVDARYRVDEMHRLSEITVPVLYNNELIGIIDSEHSEKNFFTERHFSVLQTIAGMIAIKIKTIETETALQQTKEALKQKQLEAAEALLQGQEEERSRLAQDLHDGLGGMLNGVKLSFNNMKEDLIMPADNVASFEQSIKQLDATISELRKISHNLMPDVLMRFGLTEALDDYCKSVSNSKTSIAFQQLGTRRQLNNTVNLYVYRIIQELVNNAVKHANTTQIIAQLTFEPTKILITVDDNGKGFNTADLINNKGVGMNSIKQRVDYLNGKMDIDSKSGTGTSVNIELNA